jgi:universal stress protein E
MSLPQRILVVVDPTADAHPAVERAAWIARKTRARVELFICAFAPQTVAVRAGEPPDVSRARKAHVENQLRRLHELARPLTAEGIDVRVDAVWDSPLHEGIVRKAMAAQADLVVKDTQYHAALKRALFSNTDWNLIRACPAPLWLVKPRATGAKPCFVAAVDPLHERDKPRDLDLEILTSGAELSGALGGQFVVFHAFDVAPVIAASAEGMSAPLLLPVPELIDGVKAEHTNAVYALTDGHGIRREQVHIKQGGTREQLLALTDRLRADVVVMGAVSRRGLARVFLGNTAEEVLDKLGCDLLIVKPPALMDALRGAAA